MLISISFFSLRAAWGKEVILDSKEVRIARVVERYVALHYASFDSLKYELVIEGDSKNWVVTFKLPDGAIGGTPTIVLNKITLEILEAYRTQ